MTSHLFSSFRDASSFAKQMALERKGKVSLVRNTEGFIVECAFHVDAQVRKYAETSLEYDEWVKEQGIEKSGAAEGQWFEAYKAGTELQNYSTKDSAAEQQKKNDELTEQITERDIKEFREKLGRLLAEEDKKRKEKLLSDQKALEDRERNKAKKIKERDERLEADRIKRENVMSLHKPQTKRRAQKKITGAVLPDQDSRRRTTICPRCGGDGGVNGGCAKCDGTGWVDSLDLNKYPIGQIKWSVNEFGTREEHKKMRGQLWGDMRKRGR